MRAVKKIFSVFSVKKSPIAKGVVNPNEKRNPAISAAPYFPFSHEETYALNAGVVKSRYARIPEMIKSVILGYRTLTSWRNREGIPLAIFICFFVDVCIVRISFLSLIYGLSRIRMLEQSENSPSRIRTGVSGARGPFP